MKTTVVNIPLLLKKENNSKTYVFCSYFKLKIDIEQFKTNTQFDESDEKNDDSVSFQNTLSKISEVLFEQLNQSYQANGYITEPEPLEKFTQNTVSQDELWFNLSFKLEIQQGIFEKAIPKLLLISAVMTQAFTLFSAGISIYVKGISIPFTIVLASFSAISTLINFTQSGAMLMGANAGQYLDHKPFARCGKGLKNLDHKPLWVTTGLITFGIWATTLVSNTISAISETEIIDKAGNQAGLSFLTPKFIFFHSMLFAISGGLTVGAFSGTFAIKACQNFTEWLISKCHNNRGYLELNDSDAQYREISLNSLNN